jgi:hypothetical protein
MQKIDTVQFLFPLSCRPYLVATPFLHGWGIQASLQRFDHLIVRFVKESPNRRVSRSG